MLRLDWGVERVAPQTLGGVISIGGDHLAAPLKIWYLETLVLSTSVRADVGESFVEHKTNLDYASPDGTELRLQTTSADGLEITSVVRSGGDEVEFLVDVHNIGSTASAVQWATSCMPVSAFIGTPFEDFTDDFLEYCFIEVEGSVRRLSELPPAIPGTIAFPKCLQHWLPANRSVTDMFPDGSSPIPIGAVVPSSNLIGCVSTDGSRVFATAWDPCQNLVSGLFSCIHSSPYIGGLDAQESKSLRGKVYISSDVEEVFSRYQNDFER